MTTIGFGDIVPSKLYCEVACCIVQTMFKRLFKLTFH
jgi:hypothetical protein